MYKLIIAGGRDFNDEEAMIDGINAVRDTGAFTEDKLEIVSGTAKGADNLGAEIATSNGIPVKEFPADWQDMSAPCVCKRNTYGLQYNALAGMKRNKQMGEYADGALIFWNGRSRGTKDMINQMVKLRKPVTVINY